MESCSLVKSIVENALFAIAVYFNDIAVNGVLPQHIENVKQVGCDLANGYIERENSGDYGPAPGDIKYFHQNHCL